jgi:hypothetical protein
MKPENKTQSPNMTLNKFIIQGSPREHECLLGDFFDSLQDSVHRTDKMTAFGMTAFIRTPMKLWTTESLTSYLQNRISFMKNPIPKLVEILEIGPERNNANRVVLCEFEFKGDKTKLWMNSVALYTQPEYSKRIQAALKKDEKKNKKK